MDFTIIIQKNQHVLLACHTYSIHLDGCQNAPAYTVLFSERMRECPVFLYSSLYSSRAHAGKYCRGSEFRFKSTNMLHVNRGACTIQWMLWLLCVDNVHSE